MKSIGCNRSAHSKTGPHPGHQFDLILLNPHASAAAVTFLPSRQLVIDGLDINRQPGGQAVDDSRKLWSV